MRRRGPDPAALGPGGSRAVLVSALLHGGVLAVLGVAMAGASGPPPLARLDASVEFPVVLEEEFAPPPEPGMPEPSVADAVAFAEEIPDEVDVRMSRDVPAGESAVGATAILGVGGGGRRVRPRRVLPAPMAAGDGEGMVAVAGREIASPAPAGLTVRARPIPDACGEPGYPARERRLGIEGAVLLEVSVDPRGSVAGVDVAESSGAPALDRAAVDAVLAWRFTPSLLDGSPVADRVRLRIRFRLADPAPEARGCRL